MAVRSEVAHNPTAKHSAVFRRNQLVQSRGQVERGLAVLVLILSCLGTIVALHGGWTPVLAGQISIAAIVGGAVFQGILTWVQWAYGDRKGGFVYLFSLVIDMSYTIYGFGPLIAPWLASVIAARGVPSVEASIGGWAIVALVSLGAAWYPENRLID